MLLSEVWSVAALAAATVLYFLYIYVRHLWILRKFKGPFPFPIIGNCYDPDVVQSILKYFAKARRSYGSIFVFFTFSQASLVVLDPIVVRRILSDGRAFPISTQCTNIFRYILGNGLVTSLNEVHRKDKEIFATYFTREAIAGRSFAFNVIADQAVDRLTRTRSSTNISLLFEICTLRMFMKFFSGTEYRQYPESERILCEMLSEATHALSQLIMFGLPLFPFLPQVKALDTVIKEIKIDFAFSLNRRRAEHAEGINLDCEDCLNAMLAQRYTEKEMFDHFITLLSAGHETTAYFVSYLVYLLAQHQDVQDQLRAEIQQHFQGRTEVTPDDIAELSYLSKVMQETLRYYAIIPLLTRTSAEEVHIKEANVTIPKGVEIVMPIAIINRCDLFRIFLIACPYIQLVALV